LVFLSCRQGLGLTTIFEQVAPGTNHRPVARHRPDLPVRSRSHGGHYSQASQNDHTPGIPEEFPAVQQGCQIGVFHTQMIPATVLLHYHISRQPKFNILTALTKYPPGTVPTKNENPTQEWYRNGTVFDPNSQ
jgi:hypothetical protein